jgi:two-component system, NarL family, response regulator NreC
LLNSNRIKLITVDDHDIYLKGINLLLHAEEKFEVVGYATDGKSALQLLATCKPDVLLLDMQLPDCDTETLLKEIRSLFPQLPILYHTLMRGTRYLHRLMQYGIQGYILKDAPFEVLCEAIETVAKGGTCFSTAIDISTKDDDAYKSTVTVPDHKTTEVLSKREIEILKLVCLEFSSADIAAQLFLSVSTVDTHRRNIMLKLGVNNSIGLVKYAIKQGIIRDV